MNFNNADLGSIKTSVHALLPDARVLLFGSRARGDFNNHSDYDVLVITKEQYSHKEKMSYWGKVHRLLVNTLKAPVDVLLNSEQEISIKKTLPGHIVKWALKEGIEL